MTIETHGYSSIPISSEDDIYINDYSEKTVPYVTILSSKFIQKPPPYYP